MAIREISVLVVRPGQVATLERCQNTLEAFRELCGCEWMELRSLISVRGVGARVDLWCDEEGRLKVEPVPNRYIPEVDMIHGTFVLTGPADEVDEEGNGGDPTSVPAARVAGLIAALGTS
jgi:hypothetical protein